MRRKIIAGIIVFCMLFGLLPGAAFAGSGLKGDVDQNTEVNMDDVVALLNHVVKAEEITTPGPLELGEVTGDNDLNMDDVVKLLNYVVKAIDSLEPADEPFSCYSYDANGNILDGYYAEDDNIWYLFLTSTQDLNEAVIHYTGNIESVSAGVLDIEHSTVQGAFEKSGDLVSFIAKDGTEHRVVAMQSTLPSVYIDLNDVTLDKIHEDKDKKYKKNSVYITDPSGEYDLTVENDVEMKGRGNTTWRLYDKKGYQIKFDEKTSVLGMGKAKKWVLLANASDDSMMRTKLVYDMAENMDMAYVCDMNYVDLWIEGEYRGMYMLGEKVEPGSSRLDLQDDYGVLIEQDNLFYMEEDYWFYSAPLSRYFVMKEIVEEEDEIIGEAMDAFEKTLHELTMYLYSTPSDNVTLETLSTMIDVDSFIKYYLVNEFALNKESFVTSFYWYKDGVDDVIHLGPLWDFDTCMGNDGASYKETYGEEHILFYYLLAAPEFYNRTLELCEVYKDELKGMAGDIDALKAQIDASAEMNYLRWDVLGKPNSKGGTDFAPTFDDAAAGLQSWLEGRNKNFGIAECKTVQTTPCENGYEIELYVPGGEEYNAVSFAVWGLENGQDDLAWYSAYWNGSGWCYTVDLSRHKDTGLYAFDAYASGSAIAFAESYNYIEEIQESPYQMHTEISGDGKNLTISFQDKELCNQVRFAVWNDKNGQNDLVFYTPVRNEEGVWQYTIELANHETDGFVNIHIYNIDDFTQPVVCERVRIL